ncbi:hypothetical protein PoB_002338300 [Plakobranchus ocellatus]|uniref:Uncharacterized protein n=1 Tax=Plakobranchus ocellatus TaxID=259542 RepID=A0AAV3ZQY7_9GAST|nr:hypothetical protein PoB_002338300 [Plakobranchus ocellatus]
MGNLFLASLLLCLVLTDAAPFLKVFKEAQEDYQDAMLSKADDLGKSVPLPTVVTHVRAVLAKLKTPDIFTEVIRIAKVVHSALKQTGKSLTENFKFLRHVLGETTQRLSDEVIEDFLSGSW